MIPFLHHWLYEDLWVPVWPNWFAAIIGFAVGYFWKGKAWLRKHEEHQKKIAEIHEHLLGRQNA